MKVDQEAIARHNRQQDDPALRKAQEERLMKAWETPTGWRYWSAVNNSEVGLWYTATAFAFMLFAGVLALIVRAQLAVPENDLVSAEFFNQAFTLHGTAMMFLFAVPIFEAVAILLLPQMLGARDLPFPRLSAFGYWSFLIGGVFVLGSIFFNAAPQGGWFMYPPLTTDTRQSGIGADIWLLGLSFIEVAAIAAAVELIVGVLKCRPPGMRINLTPLYGWYVLVVGVMILFAFPPLIAGDILFEFERMLDWPFFDPARGGDPLLWQHLFWIFGHPEVYIIFLPAIALVAMIVPTFAQRPIFGYSWIVLAAIGTGFISFGLWVHHMFTTGLPQISLGFFSAASEAVAIPTGVQIFAFLAALLAGRVVYSVPMLFVTGALAIFVIGGLTGVMVAIAPFDWQAHDTYFVVAHLHYVLIGGMLFPVVAGLYYFYPMVAGKMLSPRLGRTAFWMMFVGFNVGFFPMHFVGMWGMPRRVFTYPAGFGWELPNMLSTIGAFVFATGFLFVVWDTLRPKGRQPYAPRNVWNAGTLEWLAEVPDKPWGVRSIPFVQSRYPLWDQKNFMRDYDEGRFFLPDAHEVRRETLVTSIIDAEPIQCLRVPGPTFKTFWAAMFTGGVFVFSTFHMWTAAVVSGVLALCAILAWLWTGTALVPEKEEKDIGLGMTAPLYMSGPRSVGWWAMFITMLGDMSAFFSLIFGYFFYWTVHPDFPPAGAGADAPGWFLLGAGLLLASWLATTTARRVLSAGNEAAFPMLIVAAILAAAGGTAALIHAPAAAGLDPTADVYPATVWVLVIWTAVHAGAGIVMQLYCLARFAARRLTATYDIDIWNVALFWHFVAVTVAVTTATVVGFPHVGGGG
ncbi:cytochrome c oxidase subunit I [Lutibaculum baratangense]|uniref:cytochrome-c oxidase n=1 Tax=Lutibaculum baratangense AMV1 TaxID=631454 RepID=V4TBX3_9HYPH|nr:cytochrome c oxidase subunit I [Lutibaculum baratangense]ESR23868.1 Cytochrome c oxidase polypeptide I [Lutibaculum baratangense AMV1]